MFYRLLFVQFFAKLRFFEEKTTVPGSEARPQKAL
jgi:hypothetical protein